MLIYQSEKEPDFSAPLFQSEHIEANWERSIWSMSPLGSNNGTDPSYWITGQIKNTQTVFKILNLKKDAKYIANF